MTAHAILDLVVALVIVAGLIGAVAQIIPGGLLVGSAVFIWGAVTQGVLGWSIAATAFVLTVTALVVKYLLAGRYLKSKGVPNRSLVVGAVLGIVGFFVIPVVGLFVGFIGGTYLSEFQRLGNEPAARTATVHAMKAAGLSILIELAFALVLTGIWLVALVAHL